MSGIRALRREEANVSAFWDKVEKCKHESARDTGYCGTCSTPMCGAISEKHCPDCGVFIGSCRCMSNDGMSGWPALRWSRYYAKKYGGG